MLTTQSAGCSTLIPPEWENGVSAPSYPDPVVGPLIAAYNVLESLLDTANDRQKATMGIQRRCEARDAAAIHQATRRHIF